MKSFVESPTILLMVTVVWPLPVTFTMGSRDGTAKCGAVQFGLKTPANSPTWSSSSSSSLALLSSSSSLSLASFPPSATTAGFSFPLPFLQEAAFSAAVSSVPASAGASLRFDFARVIALGAAAVSAARLPGRVSAILFYLLLLQDRVRRVERLPFLLAVREANLGVGGLGVGAAALAAALRVGGEYDCAPIFAAAEAHRS